MSEKENEEEESQGLEPYPKPNEKSYSHEETEVGFKLHPPLDKEHGILEEDHVIPPLVEDNIGAGLNLSKMGDREDLHASLYTKPQFFVFLNLLNSVQSSFYSQKNVYMENEQVKEDIDKKKEHEKIDVDNVCMEHEQLEEDIGEREDHQSMNGRHSTSTNARHYKGIHHYFGEKC